MIFKPVAIKTPLLQEFRKKGLVSIEIANARSIKVLTKDDLKSTTQECESSRISNNKKKKKKKKTHSETKKGKKLILHKGKKRKACQDDNQKFLQKGNSIKVTNKIIDKKDKGKNKLNEENTIGSKPIQRKRDNQNEIQDDKEDTPKVFKRRKKKRGRKKKKKSPNDASECIEISSAPCAQEKFRDTVERKKKEKLDINKIIENEEIFKNTDNIKHKVHYIKWNMKGKVNILYSIMKSLLDAKFWKPTEIQEQTLENSINYKKDIIVVSKTGTGKTLTFCIPILNNIVDKKIKEYEKKKKCIPKLRCIILVPTRELAIQILSHFSYINKYINIYIATIIGGLNINKQKRIISNKPEILICTPGRLKYFLLLDNKINYLYKMKNVRYFACDEIDKMIETSFMRDINFIAKHIYKHVDDKKKFIQTFLLSATLGLTIHLQNENLAKLLSYVTIRKEKSCIINLADDDDDMGTNNTGSSILPDGLSLSIVKCEKKKILHMLFYLLKLLILNTPIDGSKDDNDDDDISNCNNNAEQSHVKKIVIFVNTIKETKELKIIFQFLFFHQGLESSIPKKYKCSLSLKKKISVYSIHSKQTLKERMQNISKFSQSTNDAIIFCTDVLSRGIDLDKCDVIIQLSCPVSDITFVHRSGRTARNFKTGTCICFITDEEIIRWKNSLQKIGLSLEKLNELEMIKHLSDSDNAKIHNAILCCNKMVELQNKIKDNKNESHLSKLAKEAELDDEEESSSDSDNPSGKMMNEEIFKILLRLKKELYRTLYNA
ncbi:RNA helicase [Plasmodium gonderi]|uniref:ATP-dependent RNA helicase n=1 Tax=Plasmodium gonderi TaxID=77519 RepID=A0A1Y1JRK4_PLAGO|nr:RNA helicase [Plasmodium gonderi]GAW82634.1 RNA helicase [Plasmodium gonderi]